MLWSQTCASSCFFSSDDRPSRGQTGESANRYLHLQHENYLWRERQRKNKLIIFQLSFPLCTGEINHLLCFKQWCSLEITNIHHKRYFLVLEHDGKHTRRITPHTMTLFFVFFSLFIDYEIWFFQRADKPKPGTWGPPFTCDMDIQEVVLNTNE